MTTTTAIRWSFPSCGRNNTRLVSVPGGWGRAHACRAGAAVTDGDIIHWLDADMVPERHEVARQMRWHHLIDHAVVLGHKLFLDDGDLASVADGPRRRRAPSGLRELFAGRWSEEHDWVEEIWRRTDDLRTAGFRAFHVHVGATASVTRELYDEAGGMDASLKLGEDVELGYRLAMRGAVFVRERSATSWHLGPSNLMRQGDAVQRYNAPFVAQRVPDFRKFRQDRGRTYRVPLIEAVVEADGHPSSRRSSPSTACCGDCPPTSAACWWPRGRPSTTNGAPCSTTRPSTCACSTRSTPPTSAWPSSRSTRRAASRRSSGSTCPSAGGPGEATLDNLAHDMQLRTQGLRSVLLPDGQVVRLEHTAAFERARRVAVPGEELDAAVDTVSETWWSEGLEVGFEAYDPDRGPGHAGVRRRRRQASRAGVTGAAPRPLLRSHGPWLRRAPVGAEAGAGSRGDRRPDPRRPRRRWLLLGAAAVVLVLAVVAVSAGLLRDEPQSEWVRPPATAAASAAGDHRDHVRPVAGPRAGHSCRCLPAVAQAGPTPASADGASPVLTAVADPVDEGATVVLERAAGDGWAEAARGEQDGSGRVTFTEVPSAARYRAVVLGEGGNRSRPGPVVDTSGWQLTFDDEFAGSALDSARWDYRALGVYNPRDPASARASDESAVAVGGGDSGTPGASRTRSGRGRAARRRSTAPTATTSTVTSPPRAATTSGTAWPRRA